MAAAASGLVQYIARGRVAVGRSYISNNCDYFMIYFNLLFIFFASKVCILFRNMSFVLAFV